MKRIIIGFSVLLAQLLIIGGLLVYPKLPVSHAVTWEQSGFTVEAKRVRGSQEEKDALNREIESYLDEFDKYYEQDILHYNHIRILANEPHLSVVEINTQLTHNATAENGGKYLPAGEKTVELWVYADGEEVKTKWVTVSDTLPT